MRHIVPEWNDRVTRLGIGERAWSVHAPPRLAFEVVIERVNGDQCLTMAALYEPRGEASPPGFLAPQSPCPAATWRGGAAHCSVSTLLGHMTWCGRRRL